MNPGSPSKLARSGGIGQKTSKLAQMFESTISVQPSAYVWQAIAYRNLSGKWRDYKLRASKLVGDVCLAVRCCTRLQFPEREKYLPGSKASQFRKSCKMLIPLKL